MTSTETATIRHWSGEDPRIKFAEFNLPEERFLWWERWAFCLCGCMRQTSQKHGKSDTSGEYAFFCRGHLLRAQHAAGLMKAHKRDWSDEQREAQAERNRATTVDCTELLQRVRQHIDRHHGGSISAFTRRHRLGDHSSLAYNLNRGVHRLKVARAQELEDIIGADHVAEPFQVDDYTSSQVGNWGCGLCDRSSMTREGLLDRHRPQR